MVTYYVKISVKLSNKHCKLIFTRHHETSVLSFIILWKLQIYCHTLLSNYVYVLYTQLLVLSTKLVWLECQSRFILNCFKVSTIFSQKNAKKNALFRAFDNLKVLVRKTLFLANFDSKNYFTRQIIHFVDKVIKKSIQE